MIRMDLLQILFIVIEDHFCKHITYWIQIRVSNIWEYYWCFRISYQPLFMTSLSFV